MYLYVNHAFGQYPVAENSVQMKQQTFRWHKLGEFLCGLTLSVGISPIQTYLFEVRVEGVVNTQDHTKQRKPLKGNSYIQQRTTPNRTLSEFERHMCNFSRSF